MDILRDAKIDDYLALNQGSDGMLLGKRYNDFYRRAENLWLRGSLSGASGHDGIWPVRFDGDENLVFDLRTPKGTVRFSTHVMKLNALVCHLDLCRRFHKKFADEIPDVSQEMRPEKEELSAVKALLNLGVWEMDNTDRSGDTMRKFYKQAKGKAKDIGLEM